ncbi:MAG: amino acid adenylation domain-containing protein [Bacteroidales bacterium]|nr:amino acid adenylation domain-containing protein [Bacteroidales bacterium]
MLFHSLLDPKSHSYFEQMSVRFKGRLHIRKFEEALNLLIDRYDIFRTLFMSEETQRPLQIVLKERKAVFYFKDLEAAGVPDIGEYVENFKAEDMDKGFDLTRDVLIRCSVLQIGSDEYEVIWSFHHILMDGWCIGIVFQEFMALYQGLIDGNPVRLEPVKPYSVYINWWEQQDKSEARAYWKKYLSGYRQKALIPEKTGANREVYEQENLKLILDRELTRGLEELASGSNVTLNTVFSCLWGILLNRYSRTEDVVFGSVVSGRPAEIPGVDKMIGLFINTVPVRIRMEDDMSFSDLSRQAQASALKSDVFCFLPLPEIQSLSELKNELIDYIIIFENFPVHEAVANSSRDDDDLELSIENVESFEQTNYNLNIVVAMGDELLIKFNFNRNVYDPEIISGLMVHLKTAIQQVIHNHSVLVGEINFLNPREREQLLYDFNRSAIAYPPETTLSGLFEEQAAKTPGHSALVFGDTKLTYGDLNEKANRVAGRLREKGAGPESLVAILMDRSFDMIIGILGILKSGAAYLPINPGTPEERLSFLIGDSGAKILIKQSDIDLEISDKLEVLNIEEISGEEGRYSNPEKLNQPEDLAYVIYTSGSTGTPKGVMIEQKSIANRLLWRREEYRMGSGDSLLMLINYTFDAFVTTFFTPVISGATVVLVSEEESKNPLALAKLIGRNRISHFSSVPTLCHEILEALSPDEASSLKVITLGGEKINPSTVKLALEKNRRIEIVNEYGPTECTVITSIMRNAQEQRGGVIGKPVTNTKAYILDPNMRLLPTGIPGELCVSGTGLARGYLNHPELTAEKFSENPFEAGTKMYRTGDLCKWLPDGNIEFMGRIDYQVKVRGYRIEPGEIETQLVKHPLVKEAVVQVFEDSQKIASLYAYYLSDNDINGKDLRIFLSRYLPEYMIPAAFIRLERMPLSPSGKIDRKALPHPGVNIRSSHTFVAPSNETEELLVKIWKEVLELPEVGVEDHFFSIGGHSLKATAVITKISRDLNVEVPLREIFQRPTIRALAQYIREAVKQVFIEIEKVEQREYYPVSSAQSRLYIIHKLEGEDISYNTPNALVIEENVEPEKIEMAFRKLIARHEAFRTSFDMVEGVPVQRIADSVDFHLERIEAAESQVMALLEDFIRPFDLSRAPLLRAKLIHTDQDRSVLFYDMHHIIADGTSINILVNDFFSFYQGQELPDLRIQYKDFAVWQNRLFREEAIKKQEEYWLNIFSGEIPVINLPMDFIRPGVQSFEGKRYSFTLDIEKTHALNRLARDNEGTLFMVLLALFNVFLSKYSGQEDIIIGSPIAGRQHSDLDNVIGMFVNTLALRNFPKGEMTFRAFLRVLMQNTLNAYENQDYQFETLVEKLNLQRDLSRNPLFDVMFVMQNTGGGADSKMDMNISPYSFEHTTSKFDLTLEAIADENGILMVVEYCTRLFNDETVKMMADHMISLAEVIIRNPNIPLSHIDLCLPHERDKVLIEFNDTFSEYPREKTIHALFEKQAEETPEAIAVVYEDQGISYHNLNQQANRIASYLRKQGVQQGVNVGILLQRSLEFVAVVLGVLKAGGTIVPIDPKYPEKRIIYVLEKSAIAILLTRTGFYEMASSVFPSEQIFDLDVLSTTLQYEPDGNLGNVHSAESILYVIYTSGSTGEPKGVMITHRNMINLLFFQYQECDIDFKGRILQFTTPSFDVCYQEIFSTLLRGGELHILTEQVKDDPFRLLQFIEESRISVIFLPTAYLKFIMNEKEYTDYLPVKLKHIITAGEQLIISDSLKAYLKKRQVTLHNHYGPSETHVVTTYTIDPSGDIPSVPFIGKPISNTRIYILDRYLKPQPIGIAGELYIAGDNVGKGYLNRPDLTEERFMEDPFRPGERMYKSGDLARWRPDGHLEFFGRTDHQVKIRGFRIELGEIESRLLQYPGMKEVAVIDREDNEHGKYLCAYFSSQQELDVGAIREFLSLELPDYMVPAYFIPIDKIPLTPNGKVDRRELPGIDMNLIQGETYVAPGNEIEEKLVSLWQDLLEIEKIGVSENFFALGGHSLKATILTSRIYKEFEVEFPLRQVFKNPTVAEMARYIQHEAKISPYSLIRAVEKRERYPVSSAQKRLYIINQFEGIGVSYNMPSVQIIEGELDVQLLINTFKQLTKRHEAFRTCFEMVDGELYQKVVDDFDFELELYDSKELNTEQLIEDFVRPFDLGQVPLCRVGLIKKTEKEHLLLFDMHHIISDGTSMGILIDEFTKIYKGEALPALRIQYKDFSVWQNEAFMQESIKKQERYWLSKFDEELPLLNLPCDYPRPPIQDFSGNAYSFHIGEEMSSKLKALALEKNSTLNIVLLTAYFVLLHRYTGQEDIVIGHGVAGRPHVDLENIVGMFINMLVIRNRPSGDLTFRDFFNQVTDMTLEAFENQDYQFEVLVDKIDLSRDMSRNPLFDVSFVTQNMEIPEMDLAGLTLKSYGLPHQTSKFDLTLYAIEEDGDVFLIFEYCTALFSRRTIEIMSEHYIRIIENILENPGLKLSDIDLLTAGERELLLREFIAEPPEQNRRILLHQLVEAQTDLSSDLTALVFRDERMSYLELDREANRLARYLMDRQVYPETRVGILLENSLYQIIAVLGILKAGGAYVPIDPALPEERIRSIIEDAQISLIVSGKNHLRVLNRLQWECSGFSHFLCLDTDEVLTCEEPEKNELMNEKLWNYVALSATDSVSGGGWVNSFTGENLSTKEMNEYGHNVLEKLKPYLHSEARVLEIGCASGITMYSVAPMVKFYYGTDLSVEMIRKNKDQVKNKGIQNIQLEAVAAGDIDRIAESGFDLVIINSVIQCFNEHNYLRNVIRKVLNHLNDKGVIFIGDIMDHDLKFDLIRALKDFKDKDHENLYKTKTDLSAELFVSRGFFEDLQVEFKEISGIKFSKKIGTIENELTLYRFDTVIEVDKTREKTLIQDKMKLQEDQRALASYSTGRVFSPVTDQNLAYVIYTSGTTGKPKGVMIEHRSIVNTLLWRKEEYRPSVGDKVLQLFNIAFDGFLTSAFTPLISGGQLILVGQEDSKNPIAIKNLIADHGITNFICVPTLFQAVLNCMEPKNLVSLRLVTLAGEAVSLELIRKAMEMNPDLEISNEYGPTENSVATTFKRNLKCLEKVTIGKPVTGSKVYILEPGKTLAPIGISGEICVSGIGVARGYLENRSLTEEKFVENPFEPGTRMYLTGDLGRWMQNGEIEFLGRGDHQVKIRGFRIELGDIESCLLKHPFIGEVVVDVREDSKGSKFLVAYYTSSRKISLINLRNHLSLELPDYMIPSYLVPIERVPWTNNGKVNRRALPKPGLIKNRGVEYLAPVSDTEKSLAAIWEDVLDIDRVGLHDNFFAIGGHSLKATILVSRIFKEMNVEIPLREIFRLPTILELTRYIEKAESNVYSSINIVSKKEYYPVSSAQKRQYVLDKLEDAGTTYNMPGILWIDEELDLARFEAVFDSLIKRHDAFRTSFEMRDGQPVQIVHDSVDFKIQYLTADESSLENIVEDFIRPFDLSLAPLLRVTLVQISDSRYLFLYDMHHIISDGTSMGILNREFMALYFGRPLLELRLQYKDYAAWQNELYGSQQIKKAEEYWLDELRGEIPVLAIPTDFTRPPFQSFEGENLVVTLKPELSRAINQLSIETGSTLFMIFLAIYNILLSRYSGQDDIIVGSPVAGRAHTDLENIIGMFLNTLVLRNYPKNNKSFLEFLGEVKENSLKAFEHQIYPFEDLVEKLDLRRDLSRNPLFDVMFIMQNMDMGITDTADLAMTPYQFENKVSKVDMTLQVLENLEDKNITLILEYSTKLYLRETVEKILNHFINLTERIVLNPKGKIGDFDLLSAPEKVMLLQTYNSTKTDYPFTRQIHQFFEEQAALHPGKIAVSSGGGSLSYQELNEEANRLAHVLVKKGVEKGQVVGLLSDRSVYMIIGLLGILKSGASYLPVDAKYPPARKQYILEDSGARVLLTLKGLEEEFSFDGIKILLDDPDHKRESSYNPGIILGPLDPAYIIYTSGSTGQPKGVIIPHRAVVNFMTGMVRNIGFGEEKVMLCLTSMSFDIFVLETLVPLAQGLKVVIADDKQRMDARLLHELMLKEKVQMIQTTPSRLLLLMAQGLNLSNYSDLSDVMIGGEAFPEILHSKLSVAGNLSVYNMYGPTETTVWSSMALLSRKPGIHIGKPIINTQIYIVDSCFHLVPPGVTGELCIGGDGLALGYWRRPELTAEKFIDNPFVLGEKMYRTGDLARWLPDGNIECLGRIDHQVKVRGYRIELEEIENQLMSLGSVKSGAVIVKNDRDGNAYLCAYYTAESDLTVEEIRSTLIQSLPDYMVPSVFIQLESIPLTPNGKIDRKALPEPEENMNSGREYVEPRNEVEKKLAKIWQEILEVAKVGCIDSFFEIGGHSIRVINLLIKTFDEFGVEYPMSELFSEPTIEHMGEYITNYSLQASSENLIEAVTLLNSDKEDAVFAFPGIGSYVLVYKVMAQYFKKHSFFAFNFIENENRLKDYAYLISSSRKKGPYILMGYSAGGNLAFEVAKEMNRQGLEVSDLILIDSTKEKPEPDDTENTKKQKIDLDKSTGNKMMDQINRRIKKYIEFLETVDNSGIIHTNIHLIQSEDPPGSEFYLKGKDKWGDLTDLNFKIYQGKGTHNAMLESPNLKYNSAIIQQILDDRDGNNSYNKAKSERLNEKL